MGEIKVISPSDQLMYFFPRLTFHNAFPLKYSSSEDLNRICCGYSFPELIKNIAGCLYCCAGIPADRRMAPGPAQRSVSLGDLGLLYYVSNTCMFAEFADGIGKDVVCMQSHMGLKTYCLKREIKHVDAGTQKQ